MKKGTTWNESETYKDPITSRQIRRITTRGLYNNTPTYITGGAFTSDGEYLVLGSIRDGKSHVLKCKVKTGDLTVLAELRGTGGRCSLHRASGNYPGDDKGVEGWTLNLSPKGRWCAFPVGRTLQAVHIDTLEERILIKDIGSEWIMGIPSVSPNGESVVVPIVSAHPQIIEGEPVTKAYFEFAGRDFPNLKIVEVPIAGGKAKTIYQEKGCYSIFCMYNPKDPNILLLERVYPARFYGRSDIKIPRNWLLNRKTGKVKLVKEKYPSPWCHHASWNFDGKSIVYHGPLRHGSWHGQYLGVMTSEGDTIREDVSQEAKYYGHVTADPKRKAIILDGKGTPDLLVWYYYDLKVPRVEVIARHDTEWRSLPGQLSHPHPLADPTGRWISFNSAHSGRSDVFVVDVKEG